MAKKKAAGKTSKTPPAIRTWRVNLPGSTEEVRAHDVGGWDGCLTFTVADGDNNMVVRGFAPGQWVDYTLVVEPTPQSA